MLYIVSLTVLITAFLVYEAFAINAARKKLKIRILVNGTRGKSSVTELITAILSECSIKTLGKITGVVPSIITEGNVKVPLKRKGRARVQEQVNTLFKTDRSGCEAAVFECMSISPELQRVETRILDPHIYIITNIRSDHLEVMGYSIEQRIKAYCDPIKPEMKVITADRENIELIRNEVIKRNAKFYFADEKCCEPEESLTSGLLPSNALTAIKACQLCGIDVNSSIEILNRIEKEEETKSLLIDNKVIEFINKFSLNDIESADLFMSGLQRDSNKDLIFIFNTRADRPLRTKLFSQWFAFQKSINRIYVSGTHIPAALRLLKKNGIKENKLRVLSRNDDPLEIVLGRIEKTSVIVGIGNIAGDGFRIIESFYKIEVNRE